MLSRGRYLQVWEIRPTDKIKGDDGKDILTFEKSFKHKYEKDEILSIYPRTTDNLAANFTIEKGSYIRFTYSWKKDK